MEDGAYTDRESPEPPAAAPLRVIVVDDHDLFRTGLRRLLDEQDDLDVVADARRGAEGVQLGAVLRPDVVVMDLNMPGMSGIEATRALREVSPHSAVVMLTVSADDDDVLDAIVAGASGYLLKDSTLPEIVRGIHRAAAGQSLVSPEVAGSLLERVRRHGRADEKQRAPAPELSPRELDVLRLVVAGYDNNEIGRRLHLSASTIKHHVSSTLEKLGVDNRIQAAVMAVRRGIVDGSDGPSG